jgi:hypothetical protein
LAVRSPATLLTHESGDHRLKINRQAAANTASLLFQTGFAGQGEIGLAGDGNLRMKASADGAVWRDALVVDGATGVVSLPQTEAAGLAPMRENLLLNPAFRINQRGFAGGALAAGSYGFDRWKAATGGADCSLAGNLLTLAGGELEQIVEPGFWGLASLAGLDVTMSFEAPSADVAVTVAGVSGIVMAGAGQRSATLKVPAGATGAITVKFKRSGAGTLSLGRVKLEIGAAASGWRPRPAATELQLCRWYHQTLTDQYLALTNDTSVPRNIGALSWSPMRTSPAINVTAGGIVGQHTTAPAVMTSSATSIGLQWTAAAYRNITGAGIVSLQLNAEL